MKRLSAILAVILPSICFGLDCSSPEVSLYFGNGMFNSHCQAKKSAFQLQVTLVKNRILKSDEQIKIAYNLNEPALEELLQVTAQKREEAGRKFFRWLADLSLAPSDFRMFSAQIARIYDQVRYLQDVDLKTQLENYRAEITSGRTILVVAHSQGNFYANSAWHLLNATKETAGHFSIVGVAAPVNSIAGDGPYTTLSQDAVINTVRILTNALPPNATNLTSSLSGHEFVSQYLEGNKSGPKIVDDIRKELMRINDLFTTVGKETLAYQDQSLWPFVRYACVLKNQSAKFTDAECVALSALSKTYDWFGEDKRARNLTSLLGWIDDCEKDSWHDPARFDFNDCTLLGDLPSMAGASEGRMALAFVSDFHPECRWRDQEVGRHASRATLHEARQLLRSPPAAHTAKTETANFTNSGVEFGPARSR